MLTGDWKEQPRQREPEEAAAEIERLREQAHYATGTADLAMKHRDIAEKLNIEVAAFLDRLASDMGRLRDYIAAECTTDRPKEAVLAMVDKDSADCRAMARRLRGDRQEAPQGECPECGEPYATGVHKDSCASGN